MKSSENRRQQQKAATRQRLLDAAAARLRHDGPDGTAVADVMADAGLTHGGFYSHFEGKEALIDAAFQHAMTSAREDFFRGLEEVHGTERLRWLAGRYLSPRHRDEPHGGCAFACLAGDAARPDSPLSARFELEFLQSLDRVSENEPAEEEISDTAIAFLSLCIGGLQAARAVEDPALSERILRACRQLAPRLMSADNGDRRSDKEARRRTPGQRRKRHEL